MGGEGEWVSRDRGESTGSDSLDGTHQNSSGSQGQPEVSIGMEMRLYACSASAWSAN